MTVTDIIEDALDLFDEPADTDGKYNRDGYKLLTRLVNRVYADVCKKTNCSRTTIVITTNPDQREYALPPDNIGVRKVMFKGSPLIPIFEDKGVDEGGYPLQYYTIGRKFIGFNPLPKDRFEMTVHHFNRPTADISGDAVPAMVPDDYHYVISYGVTAELFMIDKGDRSNGFIKWNGIYLTGIDIMKAELRKKRDKFPSLG